MKADINPQVVFIVLLVEFLFGLGYNALVAWAHKHNLMHVSLSVVIGVTGTLVIPAVTWFETETPFWFSGILLMLCFTASGVPMIVGSMRRTVKQKDSKKPHAWPTKAQHAREDAVMELSAMAHEIAEKAKQSTLTVSDLPDYVNRLHIVIGTLKSV